MQAANFLLSQDLTVNCGSFALDYDVDWYHNYTFHQFGAEDHIAEELVSESEFQALLEEMAQEITEEFPDIERLPFLHNPNEFPEDQIIGFRVALSECQELEDDDYDNEPQYWLEDFHFILRNEGEWYHKPGWLNVEHLEENPHSLICDGERWGEEYRDFPYNSRICWFRKPKKNIRYVNDEGEYVFNG